MSTLSDSFYQGLQDLTSDLLPQFEQGSVVLRRYVRATDPAYPDDAGPVVDTLDYSMSAAVNGVEQKYVNGSTIIATDEQVVCAIKAINREGTKVSVTPRMGDEVYIDGKKRAIKAIKTVPPAGVPVVNIIFIEA